MEGFTLGLTVKKEVSKVVSCAVSLMLTLNWDTDTLLEKLKKVTSTILKMCHLRRRLRMFLFSRKIMFRSQDIQVFNYQCFTKSVTS